MITLYNKTAGNGAKKNILWNYRGMSNFTGGDEGIRTLDTVAGIPHFQCGALDQLCDVSEFCDYSASSAESGVSSVSSSATSSSSLVFPESSAKEFSNSASISRNIGSSLAISKDTSESVTAGVSL